MDEASALLGTLRNRKSKEHERAARSLRILAKENPRGLDPHSIELLASAMGTNDLKVRWNLIVALGKTHHRPTQWAAAVDWLFERLGDVSPLTRTLALQALFDLSDKDAALRSRLLPIARDFLQNGTAAMRARARQLLSKV